ncbi:YpmA family protein [Moorella sulfitireducens (nom. illeg.)]|uniref:YpmA family protein n=1 Tax=Neomoorella sulfitireducens TaxID=2972948 RepID=UPI0021AC0EF1|nr:YpmA family protein [Moorella sulfitireducens]
MRLLASKSFASNDELYKIVDLLNKTLKDFNLMFGLSKDTNGKTMTLSIYEV